jgi:acyl-coenzyme A thioesterase PaaI-like protein
VATEPTAASRATVAELAAVLAATRFVDPYGFRVLSCAPGVCELELPFHASLERPGGIVNGIALMGAADVAMWLAIMTLRGTAEQWVTADLKTAFLKSGRSENIVCTARVLKLAARSAYGAAECRASGPGMLTHHVVTYLRAD